MTRYRWALLGSRRRGLGAITVVILVGILCHEMLLPWSLDTLLMARQYFFQRARDVPKEVAIVYLDVSQVASWRPYGELVRTLDQRGARSIVFDVWFDQDYWARDDSVSAFSNLVA